MYYRFIFLLLLLSLNSDIFAQSVPASSHYFRNNFPGGQIIIDGETCAVPLTPHLPNRPIGIYRGWAKFAPDNYAHPISAIDNQNVEGYKRVFQNWTKNGTNLTADIQFSTYPIGSLSGTIFEAVFWKMCNISFVSSNNSNITIDNQSYGSSTPILEKGDMESICALSSNYTNNGINFVFQGWRDNDGNVVDAIINPSKHTTYTAVFKGYPTYTNRNLTCISAVGEPITLTWTDHPNPEVTYYQVWIRTKHKDGTEFMSYMADVNRGVQTFTDNSFIRTTRSPQYTLLYDIRAVHAPTNTAGYPNWTPVIYANINPKIVAEEGSVIPEENKLYDNYPNPFNPETVIRFSIKDDSHVSLKVFDILGNEVESLVNEYIPAGTYSYTFNAANLASGLYIYSLKSKDFAVTKKMMLTK